MRKSRLSCLPPSLSRRDRSKRDVASGGASAMIRLHATAYRAAEVAAGASQEDKPELAERDGPPIA